MAGSRTIGTILTLKDKLSSPLVRVSKNVQNVTRDMKKAQNQIQKFKDNAVKGMDKLVKTTAKVGLAIAGLAAGAVVKIGFDGLKELQEGAAKVKSIAKEALDLKNIQKDLLKYSTATGISVNELAETQYSAISSGVKAAESMQASVNAAKLAKAGFTDSNSALKIMTSTMNVYGLTGSKVMQDISDKLLVTQNLGVTTVAELSESMGSLTPIANSAGASIDELMAGMASLTKNGLKTDEAVTSFKGILTSVISPSSEAAKMAKKLGIDFSVSAIKSKGFAKFLEEIKTKTKGNTTTMGQLFGNVRALSGALILSGKGLGDFNTSLTAMKNSTGATDEAFNIMTNTIGHKLNKFKNTSKNVFTSIMNTQSGLIGGYIDKIDNWVTSNEEKIQQWVNNIGNGISKIIGFVKEVFATVSKYQDVIIGIGTFIVTIYAVIKAMNFLKTTLSVLNVVWLVLNGTLAITPIGWIIIAIGALVAVFVLAYKNSEVFRNKVHELFSKMKELGLVVVSKVVAAFKVFAEYFKTNILPILQKLFSFFVTNIIPVLISAGQIIWSILCSSFNVLKDVLMSLWSNALVPLFGFFNQICIPIFKAVASVIMWLWSTVLAPLNIFILNVFKATFETVLPIIGSIFDSIFTNIGKTIDVITMIFSGLILFISGIFTGNWSKAWQGVRQIFDGIFSGLSNIVLVPVMAIVKGINYMISKINDIKIKIPDWMPGGGKEIGFSIPTIPDLPQFAKGGIARTPSIFGEAGAEMAIPLKRNNPRSNTLLRQADNIVNPNKRNELENNSQLIINIYGNVYGEEDFVNKVGKAITNRAKLQLANI